MLLKIPSLVVVLLLVKQPSNLLKITTWTRDLDQHIRSYRNFSSRILLVDHMRIRRSKVRANIVPRRIAWTV